MPFPTAEVAPVREGPHPAVLLLIVLALLMVLAVGGGLWHLRRDTLALQQRNLALLAGALADELERGLQGVSVALQATRDDLREGRLVGHSAEADALLQARAQLVPLVRALWAVDLRGQVLAGSAPTTPPPITSFLPAPSDLPGDAVAVSQPYGDMALHETAVALAMRFVDPHGRPAGWVLAEVPADELRGAFAKAAPGADTRLLVRRGDGVRLAGFLGPTPRDRDPMAEAQPRHRLVHFDDGTQRLLQTHALERFPITVALTRDSRAALSRWRELAQVAGASLVVVLSALAGLLLRMLRAEQARQASQRALLAEQARSRRQRERSQRLQALGTLAGGVAHDFNNILAAVIGYGEMARGSAPEGSAQARQIDQVLQAGLRGKAVVERILASSHQGKRTDTVFALQPMVHQVLDLVAPRIGTGVQVKLDLPTGTLAARGEATGCFEALMNLCTNALLAMPDGGTLSLALSALHIEAPVPENEAREGPSTDSHWLSHGRLAPGDYAVLAVRDTGTGIAPADIERLFEPFFTTRAAGQGTGLGLAVVHGVVESLGGGVDVQSTPGEGSCFTLYLPLASADEHASMPADTPVDEATDTNTPVPPGQGQTVLLVDDEPALVALGEELLAAQGYEPVGFSDPQQALVALRAQPDRFDVVITDQVMPTLSGTAFAEAVRALRPDLPVLLLSGWGGAGLDQRSRAAGVRRVLAKPLQARDLAQALASVLAA